MVRQYAGYPDGNAATLAATLGMLRYFKAFLVSTRSTHMKDVSRKGWQYDPRILDKAQARRRLTELVDIAINRRAGIPDEVGRIPSYVWRRDQHRLQDISRRRVRHYQFETKEVGRRLGHLLSDRRDD